MGALVQETMMGYISKQKPKTKEVDYFRIQAQQIKKSARYLHADQLPQGDIQL